MHIYQIAEGTEGIVMDFIDGKLLEWSTRKPLTFSDEDLVFDRVRMSNDQVKRSDWNDYAYCLIEQWCEEGYMGFVPHRDDESGEFMLIVKERDVATYA